MLNNKFIWLGKQSAIILLYFLQICDIIHTDQITQRSYHLVSSGVRDRTVIRISRRSGEVVSYRPIMWPPAYTRGSIERTMNNPTSTLGCYCPSCKTGPIRAGFFVSALRERCLDAGGAERFRHFHIALSARRFPVDLPQVIC